VGLLNRTRHRANWEPCSYWAFMQDGLPSKSWVRPRSLGAIGSGFRGWKSGSVVEGVARK